MTQASAICFIRMNLVRGKTVREIKFRAWNHAHGEMVNFDNDKLCNDEYQRQHLARLMAGNYGDVLMQYTGVKDEDGIEIYEGHIVEESRLLSGGVRKTNLEVKYKSPSFCVGDLELSNFMGITRKVIGNIYENPELLESNPAYRGDE